ncbi:hypothetical protein N9230_02965 [Akkermansiaceae bacterium]|nr:hypothetical protein [Akkermansiaceae bacterium]
MKFGITTIICSTLVLSSCEEEDEALLAEYEAQKDEIADLEFQINRLNKKITENHIADPSDKVAELKSQLQKLEEQKNGLLDDISKAKAEAGKASEKLEQYKQDYPIKGE